MQIQGMDEFRARLGDAVTQTRGLGESVPAAVLDSIRLQLEDIQARVAAGESLDAVRDSISFDVVAVRNLDEDEHVDYCELLSRLAAFIRVEE